MNTSAKQNPKSGAKGLMPALVIAAALLLAGTAPVQAGQSPGVLPPGSKPHGKSYSEWSAAWTQWALSFPLASSPVVDTTGALAAQGQDGPVWFLAGTFGGTAERTVTVPPGKALLFPLYNWFWVTLPTDPPITIDEIRALLAPLSDNATLTLSIDGRNVGNLAAYREQSIVFSVTMPDDNLFGVGAGTYEPCVEEGYYVMLAPLSAGRHTISFSSASADGSFSLAVTYHLTVR